MANVVIDIAAEYTGNKAFKQAETSTQKLEKSVAKLGKQLLGVFAAGKLLSFGKQAAKAFAADEKAARSLALALANTGNAFAAIEVEKFIADLQRTTGVLDDNLRPAFRTLLTATGDVKKSQDGLALALDIAAGTGRDLGSVSLALSKAYGGQTTALSRLGAGLSKATLASGDLDLITAELTKKFSGQALAAAEGYSGQMDRLTVASNNAKEIIGKDLLNAMSLISGKDGIGGATTAMEGFATEIGNAIYGIGVLISKLNSIPGAGVIKQFVEFGTKTSAIGYLTRLGANAKARSAGTPAQSPGERKKIDKINADAVKIQKQLNALKTIENNNTKEKLLLTAGEKALMELKKMFDLEGIQIQAALNGVLTEEERARVLGLKAIKDSDTALALQALAALKAADATTILAGSLKALSAEFEFERMRMALGKAQVAGTAAAMSGISPIASSQSALDTALKLYPDFGTEMDAARSAAARGGMNNIVVNVQGSVTTERDLVSAITQGIYNNQASGIPINYSTSYV
jgi:hypothetical protein